MKNLFYTSPKYLQNLKGIKSSASEIDGYLQCHPQIAQFKYELERGTNNLKVFTMSDSTGNENTEFIYFFTQWLSQEFSKYTTYWYAWDDIAKTYKTPVSFGNGGKRVDVFCFGIGGTRPEYIFPVWNKAVKEIVDLSIYPATSEKVDLILCNHGHNIYDEAVPNIECRFEEVIEELLNFHDGVGVIMVHQNPWRDDDTSRSSSRQAVINYSNLRGFAIADVAKLFYEKNKDSSLYADNIHPSFGLGTAEAPTGTRLFLEAVTVLFNGNPICRDELSKSSLTSYTKNLIVNGGMKTWTNASDFPDEFNPYNATYDHFTVTKDTSVYETFKSGKIGWSMKIATTGGGSALINIPRLQCGNDKYSGWITVGVRVKRNPSSLNEGLSPMRIKIGSQVVPITFGFYNDTTNWVWKIGRAYVKDVTQAYATIYVDASSGSGFIVNIDRIVMCKGRRLQDSLS